MADVTRVHPRAGQPAQASDLVDIPGLVAAYYTDHPDAGTAAERVAFGTSGHRGSSLRRSFNEDHVVAISQAICEYRQQAGIDGPLFLARDPHALSEPAMISALVLSGTRLIRKSIDQLRSELL